MRTDEKNLCWFCQDGLALGAVLDDGSRDHRGEDGSEAVLVSGWCDDVERVAAVEKPLRRDVAAVRRGGDDWVGPGFDHGPGGRVDRGSGAFVVLPDALEGILREE